MSLPISNRQLSKNPETMNDQVPTYSIVIPCYRSGKWLDDLIKRIDAVMGSLGEPFELILVNDASPDDTWDVIERNAKSHHFVRGFDLLYNTGQFRATICGFEHVRGQFVITMDDDLQHPPEEIPKLINAVLETPNLDCVIGAFHDKEHSFIRNIGSSIMSRLNEIFYDKPRGLKLTSFRIMRRQITEAVCAHRTIKPIIGPLILRSTRRIGNVMVEHRPRLYGKSNYKLIKLIRTTLDNIFSVSTLPLQIMSIMGVIFALGSILMLLTYFMLYMTHKIGKVPGFTTLVLLIIFFGGLTLFSIGLLGEYIIIIFGQVSRPPRYIVRKEVGLPRKS
jgi:glycosyltransferase involved in cell wall biosynthesis